MYVGNYAENVYAGKFYICKNCNFAIYIFLI